MPHPKTQIPNLQAATSRVTLLSGHLNPIRQSSGGCLAYPSYDLGTDFCGKDLGKVASKGNVAFLGATHQHFTETEKSTSFKEVRIGV
jgi:hypothetical protein